MTSLVSPLLLAAEEGGAESSGLDLVLPDTAELLWGLVAFLLVFFILSRVAFPKIRKGIEAREQQIQGNLEDAERARNEAHTQLQEYRAQLAEARGEANRIIEEARQQAEQVRKDYIARAEKDAEAIVARAQEQIDAERTRTVQELRGTIADMSIDLAEKIVGRSLDGNVQRDFVDSYIREVAGMGADGGSRS